MYRLLTRITFYFCSIIFCTNVIAQVEPSWVEIYSETSRHEEANVVLAGRQNDFYVAGIDEDNAKLQTELHSIGADGTRRWNSLISPEEGSTLAPFGLRHSPIDAGMIQLGATETTSTDFGRLVLITLDTLTGVEGQRNSIQMPLTAAYRGHVFVAADADWLVGGEAMDAATKRFRRFLTRVTTEGTVQWTHYGPWRTQLEDVYRYTDVLLARDTVYVSSQAPEINLLDGINGNQLATIAGPVSWNKLDIIGDTRIFARDQRVWWVTCVNLEIRIEELLANRFETFSSHFLNSNIGEYVNAFYDLRVGSDETLLIAGSGPHVGYYRYASDGRFRRSQTAYANQLEHPSLRTRQMGAAFYDGSVIIAGRWTFNRSYINYDASIWRINIDNISIPEQVLSYGGYANASDGTILDLLAGRNHTVEVILERGNTRHFLRVLTSDGEAQTTVSITPGELASGYYGSVHAANGDLVRLASLRGAVGPTLTSAKLVRTDPDGVQIARKEFGSLGGSFVRGDEQNIRPNPSGGYFIFFTNEYLSEVVTDIFTLRLNLSIESSIRLTDADRLAAVSDVMPVEDGSGDLVIFGSTGYTGYDPEYVARIERSGNVVWRYDFTGAMGDIESVLDVSFLDDNLNITVRTDANQLLVLSLANGTVEESRSISPICSRFSKVDTELQSNKILDFCRDTIIDRRGFAEETVDLILQDLPIGNIKEVGKLPRGYAWQPTVYLESEGQTYIGGAVKVGFRKFSFVMAFNDVLSPTNQMSSRREYNVFPNPVASGSLINIEGFLGGEYQLQNLSGSVRTIKTDNKDFMTLPNDLVPGIYFLIFKTDKRSRARIRIIVI